MSCFLDITVLLPLISSSRWECGRLLIAWILNLFFFFGVVLYFRIQKERVSEREKDLEVLQEKLAERVSYLVI